MSDMNNNQTLEIDLSYLSEIACGSVDFMIDMIDIFQEQTPQYMEELLQAARNKEWKTVGEVAHKIKPTLAFMGANTAKDIMGEIEKNGKNATGVETIENEILAVGEVCEMLYLRLVQIRAELEAQL